MVLAFVYASPEHELHPITGPKADVMWPTGKVRTVLVFPPVKGSDVPV